MKHAAILGCGSGGMSMAVDLGNKGFKVRLFDFPEYDHHLRLVEEQGKIEACGKLEGTVEPFLVTTNMAEAISGADVVFLTIRSWGIEKFIKEASKHIEAGQVLMNWSSYFTCLRTFDVFRQNAPKGAILAEGAILPYFAKPIEPAVMEVFAVKSHLWAASMPSKMNPEMIRVVKEFFPNCEVLTNVLHTSLTNPNLQVHVPPAILNTGYWERMKGNLEFYVSLVTPKVAKVMEHVDNERIELGAALGLKLLSKPEVLKLQYGQYGVKGDTMYEVYSTFSSHRSWKPGMILEDFATKTAFGEDILYGFVPISTLGNQIGVKTPAIDTMVNLAGLVLDRNYWEEGLTVKDLGLAGMTTKDLLSYVETGKKNEI